MGVIRGEICHEAPVEAPASVVWESYRGLELGRQINELMPHLIGTVEAVEGDGSAGTVLKITSPPGTPGIGYMKEVFRIMDDETRVKESDTLEGGYLHLGFDRYTVRFEVIYNDSQLDHSVIRSTIMYEIKDDSKAQLISLLSIKPLITIAQVIGDHIIKNRNR
ncbi:unnamed protein product [Linum tenue]|uniref:Bet v I/Major latex protein domain-containing protein n=1 Tax=Linum tenue TaxID=586396 RepID=A0AAV0ILJ0_9ROSI|nr:unnamed protein product [Linum tenue]